MKERISDLIIIIALLVLAVLSILIVEEVSLQDTENYTTVMEITEKTEQYPYNTKIFTIQNENEKMRLEVNTNVYNSYNIGDLVKTQVSVKKSKILHITYKFYTIIQKVGE